jgi:hypothetical protein
MKRSTAIIGAVLCFAGLALGGMSCMGCRLILVAEPIVAEFADTAPPEHYTQVSRILRPGFRGMFLISAIPLLFSGVVFLREIIQKR